MGRRECTGIFSQIGRLLQCFVREDSLQTRSEQLPEEVDHPRHKCQLPIRRFPQRTHSLWPAPRASEGGAVDIKLRFTKSIQVILEASRRITDVLKVLLGVGVESQMRFKGRVSRVLEKGQDRAHDDGRTVGY